MIFGYDKEFGKYYKEYVIGIYERFWVMEWYDFIFKKKIFLIVGRGRDDKGKVGR